MADDGRLIHEIFTEHIHGAALIMEVSLSHRRLHSVMYDNTGHLHLIPANTKRKGNAGLMLAHRLQRWPNIKPVLFHRVVHVGWSRQMYSESAVKIIIFSSHLVEITRRRRFNVGSASQTPKQYMK